MSFQDARIEELAFLAAVERGTLTKVSHADLADPRRKAMIAHLLHQEYLNGVEGLFWPQGRVPAFELRSGVVDFEAQARAYACGHLARFLTQQEVHVQLSHKGRLRWAELGQALRVGRDRDPSGILWAKRHRDASLAVAVLVASPASPTSVACLDMNGLKAINDKYGHDAGDAAIRTYLQTIAALMGDGAEGFRGDGGDEVVLVMRDTSAAAAAVVAKGILRQLAKECVQVDGKTVAASITAACGLATTSDPGSVAAGLHGRADAAQTRAKEKSLGKTRRSTLAAEDAPAEIVC